MRTTRITPQQVANKVEWEGGIGEGLMYFGPDLDSTSKELNIVWRNAYNALKSVEALLPETSDGE